MQSLYVLFLIAVPTLSFVPGFRGPGGPNHGGPRGPFAVGGHMSDDGSEEPSFVHPTFGFGISENDKELVRMSSELQTRGGSQKTNKKSIRECLGKPWRRLRSILKSPSQRRADENIIILRSTYSYFQ